MWPNRACATQMADDHLSPMNELGRRLCAHQAEANARRQMQGRQLCEALEARGHASPASEAEKGVERTGEALPELKKRYPRARQH